MSADQGQPGAAAGLLGWSSRWPGRRQAGGRRQQQPPLDAASLSRRLVGLEQAAGAAAGRLPDAAVAAAEAAVTRARERMALSNRLTVVAMAGSTGAGKSSLFNALVGQDVARTSVLRPTTAEPMAAIWWESPETDELLSWLGVARRHVVDAGAAGSARPVAEAPLAASASAVGASAALADLVLVDLPDHDSTELSHRVLADRLVARADMMIWVLDPQKYADRLVHEDYLRRYARHADVTVVALNQVDRLTIADAERCLAHLRRLVADDGLADAEVLGVSARSGQGLDRLAQRIGEAVADRVAILGRAAADVATAADSLAAAAGDSGAAVAGGTAGDDPPAAALATLTDGLVEAAGAPTIERAVSDSVTRRAATAVGWPPTRWLARMRQDPVTRLRLEGRPGVDPALVRTSLPGNDPVALGRARTTVLTYADNVSAGAPPGWIEAARSAADRGSEQLPDQLDRAVGRAELTPAKDPGWWRLVGVGQWLLLALGVLGGVWLLGLAALRYLQFDPGAAPRVEGVPVPTALLITGLVGGLVLAALGRLSARRSAARAARAARAALRVQVESVARSTIVEPVAAELATLGAFRAGLAAASGDARA